MGQFQGVELADLQLPTARLLLRPWQPSDAPAVVAALETGQMHRFLALPEPYTAAAADDFITRYGPIERAHGTGLDCAVVERDGGRVVGSATLRLPHAHRPADIGYWIAPSAQGHGYAAEATDALAIWAYEHGVHRVELQLDVENVASARVALRSGFAFEAVRRDDLPLADGRHDLAVFVRTATDPGTAVAPAFAPLPGGELTDGTVALRVMQPSDLVALAEQESDPVTVQVGFTGTAPSHRAMQRMLARAGLDLLVGPSAGLTIVDVATGQFAGAMRLRTAGPPNIAGIGYAVHPLFRGRGYTTRALRLLADWAFAGGIARLELGAKIDNLASQRAAQAAGFEPDGIWAARLRNADGTFSAEARFSRVNPRYS